MKLVPYTGLRYMHVDGGEYTDSLGIHHRADKQNVFMLPVGLKLSKENKLGHDWTVTPKLDLSYTWNMGDTDSEMNVSVPGLTSSRLGYSVMDSGSFMGVAGIEAQRKNWTYGVSYAYQKGSHQDSKKIIADIKMSF